jgi:uncharacterized protein
MSTSRAALKSFVARERRFFLLLLGLAALPALALGGAVNTQALQGSGSCPWWIWPALLFLLCLGIGIVATMGGVGGGILFVPLVSSFFPFHLDYVRGAGLVVALSCALAASPTLLRSGMVNLRLTLPPALIASCSSIVGARVGLALPPGRVQTALGMVVLGVVVVMLSVPKSEFPAQSNPGWLATKLRMHGAYHEASSGQDVRWQARRGIRGLLAFVGIGFLAGAFGLGAGWANVPVLNLLMGVPLKVAVGSSMVILSLVDSSAAWVYLHQGAVIALITVPSIIGVMLGSMIGVRLFRTARPVVVRRVVLVMLTLAGARALLKGLGIWT